MFRHVAQDLKRIKKQKMKDIIKAMEAFNENLVGGKRLVKVGLEQNWNFSGLQTFGRFGGSLHITGIAGRRMSCMFAMMQSDKLLWHQAVASLLPAFLSLHVFPCFALLSSH